jgi:YhcH/YjgK/YiaL family protein
MPPSQQGQVDRVWTLRNESTKRRIDEMIYSNISASSKEKWYPEALYKALDYLSSHDLKTMESGRYSIEGDSVFVNLTDSTTAPARERKAEAHRKYIDVQFLAEGVEDIGFACLNDGFTVVEDRLEEKDIIFYSGVQKESFVTLYPGDFAVFFPEDVHRPLCRRDGCERVRKAVVKILLSRWDSKY